MSIKSILFCLFLHFFLFAPIFFKYHEMTVLDRPQSLEEIPTLIQQVQYTPLHLDQYQEEYKRQVGISTTTHSNLHFHPKALRLELKDQQDHFHNLKNNYINRSTKQKFLECILQEPQIDISLQDLLLIEEKNKKMLTEIKTYNNQSDSLGQEMETKIKAIEQEKSKMMDTIDMTEKMIGNILTMEEELYLLKEKLDNKSKLTVEEAEEILYEQTENLTKFGKINDEKRELIEEYRWEIEQKEFKVNDMKIYADQIQNEAKETIKFKNNQNEDIAIQYKEYKEAIQLYNKILFGAESIDFTSQDVIHITFESKYHGAVLHIYIDYDKKRIDHATLDGAPQINLDQIIKMVQETSVNNGIRTIILETLDRLKKL